MDKMFENHFQGMERLKKERLANKAGFDKTHHLRSKSINRDKVMIFDSSLVINGVLTGTLHKSNYVVVKVHDNTSYSLQEFHGTMINTRIPGERIKIFKKRDAGFLTKDMEEQSFMEIMT